MSAELVYFPLSTDEKKLIISRYITSHEIINNDVLDTALYILEHNLIKATMITEELAETILKARLERINKPSDIFI